MAKAKYVWDVDDEMLYPAGPPDRNSEGEEYPVEPLVWGVDGEFVPTMLRALNSYEPMLAACEKALAELKRWQKNRGAWAELQTDLKEAITLATEDV